MPIKCRPGDHIDFPGRNLMVIKVNGLPLLSLSQSRRILPATAVEARHVMADDWPRAGAGGAVHLGLDAMPAREAGR